MKRISFFILALVYVFAANAQTFGTKHNIDVQIGTINGINYEYFLNKDMSVGAFVNVPLGFNLYFKSADAVNASPNFYTHGLNVGGFFTKYWGNRHTPFEKSGWWLSGKIYAGVPWEKFHKSEKVEDANVISYKIDYNFELCGSAMIGYTFRPVSRLYINTGLGFTYSCMFLTVGSLNHVPRPCIDLSIGYVF